MLIFQIKSTIERFLNIYIKLIKILFGIHTNMSLNWSEIFLNVPIDHSSIPYKPKKKLSFNVDYWTVRQFLLLF